MLFLIPDGKEKKKKNASRQMSVISVKCCLKFAVAETCLRVKGGLSPRETAHQAGQKGWQIMLKTEPEREAGL